MRPFLNWCYAWLFAARRGARLHGGPNHSLCVMRPPAGRAFSFTMDQPLRHFRRQIQYQWDKAQ